MDSQGFVFLTVIANFNRIRQLTQDMELVRYACLNSPKIEFRTGSDGLDRLRPREGWQQWVLAMGERDSSAQNDGPAQIQQPLMPYPQAMDAQFMSPTHQAMSPTGMQFDPAGNESMYGPLNGIASAFAPATSGPTTNGTVNGDVQLNHAPLSARVPNFSPHVQAVNGVKSDQADDEDDGDVFSDVEVENLVIVVRKRGTSRPDAPFHSAASRTYSNGSIDETTIADAIGSLQAASMSNGSSIGNGHAEE